MGRKCVLNIVVVQCCHISKKKEKEEGKNKHKNVANPSQQPTRRNTHQRQCTRRKKIAFFPAGRGEGGATHLGMEGGRKKAWAAPPVAVWVLLHDSNCQKGGGGEGEGGQIWPPGQHEYCTDFFTVKKTQTILI